jgi:signal transduction histidine kinase
MANADLPEHKELSGVVIEECDKLMLLINNMLTLAEYESGIANKKEERIDLKKLLKNLCEVFESVSEDKNITVNLELSDKELLMIGDTEKIQRSLSNLMDNAIKYSDNNGLITISAKVEKGNIEIDFTDKGCGISDENKKRIFERFYRVESSRTTTGNGLGLNLAKAFIESHNGTLSVKSEIGKGSCFKACFIS